jgi:hypothetical protein
LLTISPEKPIRAPSASWLSPAALRTRRSSDAKKSNSGLWLRSILTAPYLLVPRLTVLVPSPTVSRWPFRRYASAGNLIT